MNCRSCGRPLTDSVDLLDGLCSVAAEPCATRCYRWAAEHRPDATQKPLASPEWNVTVDEWLATR